MAMSIVGIGTFDSGVGAIAPGIPAGTVAGDTLFLVVESANQAITAPTGYTEVGTQASQATGTAAAAGGVRLAVFYKVATSSESAPSVPDSGDHTTGCIVCVRGADPVTPTFTVASKIDSAATTAMSWPTITTTAAGAIVLNLAALDADAASTTAVGAPTNASLTGLTKYISQTVIAGAGGGVAIIGGTKATAGAVSATTATGSTSTTHGYLTLAVYAYIPPTPTGSTSGLAQYLTDRKTPLAIGGETQTAGLGTNNLYLQILVNNTNNQGYDNLPGVEVRPLGTSFTNVANYTALSFLAQEPYLPTAMRGGVMGYDAVNDRFIMTGGYDGTSRFSDVWELDASGLAGKWKKLTPTGTGPAGKNLGAATMVNQNGKAWFTYWGGNTGTDNNDLTILDCTTRGSEVWTTVTQTSAPTARSYETLHLAYVPLTATTGELYYFGGWATTRENLLVKTTLNTGSTVPTALTWTTVTANGAAGSPPGRSGCIMYYDAARSRLVVHGGFTTVGVSDTWAYALPSGPWSQLTPTGTAPTGRELFAAAYDPPSQRLVVAGGWSTEVSSNNRNDIYQIDFSTSANGVFTELKTNDTTDCDIDPFSSIASAYDSDRRMFATSGLNGIDGTDRYSYAFDFTETVATDAMTLYGLNIVDWQRARDAPAHVVDRGSNEGLMINGFSGMPDDTLAANALNGDHMNEIWAYNFANNTIRYANAGIFGIVYKEGVMATYDSINDRIITFGGLTGATQTCGGVWELKRDSYGNYKARKMFPTGTPPSPRWLGALGFDSVNNRVIQWGGTTASVMVDTNIHILDLSGGGDGVWSSVAGAGTTPPIVWQPGYDTDYTNNRLYITSGSTNYGASTFSTRTDYINMSTTTPTWVNVNTTGVTGVRGGVLKVTQSKGTSDANNLFFFGGYNGTTVNNQFLYLDRTVGTWNTWAVTNPPVARRSAAGWVDGSGTQNKLYITSGRPVSGQWYRDVQQYSVDTTTAAASQSWTSKAPPVYEHDSVKVTGLTNYTSYHWQAIDTILGTTFNGSFGGNAETAADFTISMPTSNSVYTRDGLTTLPTTSSDLTTAFTSTDYSNVATTDSVFVDETTSSTALFEFKQRHGNNTDNITGTWTGKTTIAGSTRTIYLQVWNVNTSAWSTIASNSVVAANTSFTLTGTISTSVANYYDSLNIVTFRVYQ